jgi:hypothetical protein
LASENVSWILQNRQCAFPEFGAVETRFGLLSSVDFAASLSGGAVQPT